MVGRHHWDASPVAPDPAPPSGGRYDAKVLCSAAAERHDGLRLDQIELRNEEVCAGVGFGGERGAVFGRPSFLLQVCKEVKGSDIKTYLLLFDKMVLPILLYGAGI